MILKNINKDIKLSKNKKTIGNNMQIFTENLFIGKRFIFQKVEMK